MQPEHISLITDLFVLKVMMRKSRRNRMVIRILMTIVIPRVLTAKDKAGRTGRGTHVSSQVLCSAHTSDRVEMPSVLCTSKFSAT